MQRIGEIAGIRLWLLHQLNHHPSVVDDDYDAMCNRGT